MAAHGTLGVALSALLLLVLRPPLADAGVAVSGRSAPKVQVQGLGFADANRDGLWRLGCLGDSNTVTLPHLPGKWCEHLESIVRDPRFQVVKFATSGSTVNPQRRRPEASDAFEHMALAVEANLDAVVLAYGTNDIFQGYTPAEIGEAYLLHEQFASEHGIDQFFVATTPRVKSRKNVAQLQTNRILRSLFPGRTIDFFWGFSEEHHYWDLVHHNERAQRLRAKRAYRVLRPRRLK